MLEFSYSAGLIAQKAIQKYTEKQGLSLLVS
jgi:hypothetical protein